MQYVNDNTMAQYNLLIPGRYDLFNTLLTKFTFLQHNIKQFMDVRRVKFPRLYLLSDIQLMGLLSCCYSRSNFNE